jgi:hypothetical protein
MKIVTLDGYTLHNPAHRLGDARRPAAFDASHRRKRGGLHSRQTSQPRQLNRADHQQKYFLMTKIDGRTKESASTQIDQCLSRLQTDRIDLMQFYEVIRLGNSAAFFIVNIKMAP